MGNRRLSTHYVETRKAKNDDKRGPLIIKLTLTSREILWTLLIKGGTPFVLYPNPLPRPFIQRYMQVLCVDALGSKQTY